MSQEREARIERGSALADRSQEHIHHLRILRRASKRRKSTGNEVKARPFGMPG